jgi:hypothetical protein
MSNDALEFKIRNGLRHKFVIQFLRAVNFVAARIASGMEMRNVLDIVPHGPHDIAFHMSRPLKTPFVTDCFRRPRVGCGFDLSNDNADRAAVAAGTKDRRVIIL